MTIFTGIPVIDWQLGAATPKPSQLGNEVRSVFFSADRYLFDFNLDLSIWEQFDTDSDASYFGIWLNKSELRTLSYVEGDIYLTQCPGAESYDAELAHLCEFYPPAPALTAISEGTITKIYADRREHFFDPERCPPSQIKFDNDATDEAD